MGMLKEKYTTAIKPKLMEELGYSNTMQVPRLLKISVNMGLGEAIQNPKVIDAALGDMALITGQRPVAVRAKRSVANYKLREGMLIGVKATLRGVRMYEFLERLIYVALPRVRDFKGISGKAFDGHGNYSLGIREQIIFPEIDYDKVDKIRGMNVTLVTSAKTDAEGLSLLTHFGMPFRR
jgi:large subunit ribosomal protein L5